MKTFREIEASITRQVDRYIRLQRRFLVSVLIASAVGQLLGLGLVRLLEWWGQ